jgi:ketosteroid isomerase-like protein
MKNLLLFSLLVLLIGCNQTASETGDASQSISLVDVDSLNADFLAGWNNHDSAAIMNIFAEYAIVFNDSLLHKGKQEIADRWVSGGVKVLGNIKTHSALHNINGNIAYDAGTYTLDITLPDVVLKEKGNYSLVWEKRYNDWKLAMVHIEDVTQMPDVK